MDISLSLGGTEFNHDQTNLARVLGFVAGAICYTLPTVSVSGRSAPAGWREDDISDTMKLRHHEAINKIANPQYKVLWLAKKRNYHSYDSGVHYALSRQFPLRTCNFEGCSRVVSYILLNIILYFCVYSIVLLDTFNCLSCCDF